MQIRKVIYDYKYFFLVLLVIISTNIIKKGPIITKMDRFALKEVKNNIESFFKKFHKNQKNIKHFFNPLLFITIKLEKLLTTIYPIYFILIVGLLVWLSTKRIFPVIISILLNYFIVYFHIYEDFIKTISHIILGTVLVSIPGFLIGLIIQSLKLNQNSIISSMESIKSIPSLCILFISVMLFGIGKIPGMISIILYSLPVAIIYSVKNIPSIYPNISNNNNLILYKKIIKVHFPAFITFLSKSIYPIAMKLLEMSIISSLIGLNGLGFPLLKGISNHYLSLGILNSLAVIILALGIQVIFK